jgi:hypothetical protein
VGGVFLVLGFGVFFACCIGIFEFLWNVKTVAVEEKVRKMWFVLYTPKKVILWNKWNNLLE